MSIWQFNRTMKKHLKHFSVASLFFLLLGCTSTVKQSVPFDETQLTPYLAEGTATITGSAFLKTKGGEVKLGAGNTVKLFPATDYFKERVKLAGTLKAFQQLEGYDSRLNKYVRTTTADAQGNFEFKDVPAGEYYASCSITWQIRSGYGVRTTGGQPMVFVSVKAGETVKVVVTQ